MKFTVKDVLRKTRGHTNCITSTAVLTASVNEGWIFKKEVLHTFTCTFFYYIDDGKCSVHFLLDHNTDSYLSDRVYQDQAAYAILKYFQENK